MKQMFRKKPESDISPEKLSEELQQCRERSEFLLSATLSFITCVKEFSFGFAEIHADEFTARIDELKEHFTTIESIAVLQRRFAGQPDMILDFIIREKAYLAEREEELKVIIEMLRNGLTAMYGDNQTFNTNLQESNLRMERITYLDDIRRIKEQLKDEVEKIRTTVQEKKNADLKRMDSLSREVDALRQNLEKVTDASKIDPLTGAFNRLAFDINLQRSIDRYQITHARFALLMCDLDDFKRINDTHGHQVGDRVLMSFVRECKAFFRDHDFVARYGGEEFALVLSHASLRDAMKRAKKFCKTLASKRFIIDKAETDRTLIFTTSIGVSEISRDDTLETIIERADRALYLAKSSGKNLVMSEQDVCRNQKK